MFILAKLIGIGVLVWFAMTAKDQGEYWLRWAIVGLLGFWITWFLVYFTLGMPVLPTVAALAAVFLIRRKLIYDAKKSQRSQCIKKARRVITTRLLSGFTLIAKDYYKLSAFSSKYLATPSGLASIPLSPLVQPAGQTSPFSSKKSKASTIRNISSMLRPSGKSLTT